MKALLIILIGFFSLCSEANCKGPSLVSARFAKDDLLKAFSQSSVVKSASFSNTCKVGWLNEQLPELDVQRNYDFLISCGLVMKFKDQKTMTDMALAIYNYTRGFDSVSTLNAYGTAEVAVPICGIIEEI